MKKPTILINLFLFFISYLNPLSSQIFLFTFEGETEAVTTENAVGTPTYSPYGIGAGTYSEGSSLTCSGTSNDAKSNSGWNTGEAHQFIVNTTGYENMSFSVCIKSSNTDVNNFRIEVSNNGVDYITLVNDFNPPVSFTSYSGTLPATMNNQSNVFIQIYKVDEPSSIGNNIRIDNAQLAGILPVELIEFSAEKFESTVELNWRTATEINNDFFTVQHSLDGRTFNDIETINGTGNSFETKSYSYIHKNPYNGLNYYRLKQTDFNGTESFSPVESIQFGERESWSVYPTPAIDQISITLPKNVDQNISISVYDYHGKLHKHFNFHSDLSLLEISLSDLSPGQYFLKILTDNQVTTQQFFKL